MSPKQPKPMTGEQFKAAIYALGFERQSDCAELIGCQPRTVRKWISGELPVPRHIALLVRLMIKYQVKPEEL